MGPVSAVARSARCPLSVGALLLLAVFLMPVAPLAAEEAGPSPAPTESSSRADEWRRSLRALEPKVIKSGKDWQLLAPGEGQSAASGRQVRETGDEALLLLVVIQHDETVARLQRAGVPSDAIARLEREYGTARACLASRFSPSRLLAVLDEARRNRAVLEALVYRLAGFPPVRGRGPSP